MLFAPQLEQLRQALGFLLGKVRRLARVGNHVEELQLRFAGVEAGASKARFPSRSLGTREFYRTVVSKFIKSNTLPLRHSRSAFGRESGGFRPIFKICLFNKKSLNLKDTSICFSAFLYLA